MAAGCREHARPEASAGTSAPQQPISNAFHLEQTSLAMYSQRSTTQSAAQCRSPLLVAAAECYWMFGASLIPRLDHCKSLQNEQETYAVYHCKAQEAKLAAERPMWQSANHLNLRDAPILVKHQQQSDAWVLPGADMASAGGRAVYLSKGYALANHLSFRNALVGSGLGRGQTL